MSFAINPSLTHIDIQAANILMLYRSKGQVQLADTRFRNHPCEAFICVYREDKTVRALVALLETGMNSIFVYTSDFSAEQSPDYPKVLAEAQSFTASFGFTMEKVNLDFSPAMREVIIKGISVLNPPKKRVKLRSLSSLEHLEIVAPKPAEITTLPPAVTSGMGQSDSTDAPSQLSEPSSAKALIEKITREKAALEQSASREIARLKAVAEKAAEAKKSCEHRLTKEIEALKAEQLAAASNQDSERIQQLETALAKAEVSANTLAEELTRLAENSETIAHEKLQLEQLLAAEKNSSAELIRKLTAEIGSANALLTSEKSLAADKIATLTLFETSWRESQQREEDLCRNIDLMQKQIGSLEADLEKQRLNEQKEDALLLKIATLEKEAEEARTEFDKLAGSTPDLHVFEAEIKTLKAAKNDVESEYIRMANEIMAREAETLENFYKADAEILRLSRELELQRQAAHMETEALRDELRQLQSSGTPPLPPVAAVKEKEMAPVAPALPTAEAAAPPAIVPIEPEPSPAPAAAAKATAAPSQPEAKPEPDLSLTEDDTPDGPVVGEPEIVKGLLNEFGSFCGSSGHAAVEFKIDPGLSGVEYSDPAEVVAILYSSNSVQAIPDGIRAQRCKGYVLATHKSGEYRTYVAWHLLESQKVVICAPEQQPADARECTQFLADAITYFEVVGLMMELEDLGSSVRSYNRAIRKVPALVRK